MRSMYTLHCIPHLFFHSFTYSKIDLRFIDIMIS